MNVVVNQNRNDYCPRILTINTSIIVKNRPSPPTELKNCNIVVSFRIQSLKRRMNEVVGASQWSVYGARAHTHIVHSGCSRVLEPISSEGGDK